MNASFPESESAANQALLNQWAKTLSVDEAAFSKFSSFQAALESLKQHAIEKINGYLDVVNSAAKTEIKTENLPAAVKEFNAKYARGEIKVDNSFEAQGEKGVKALSAIFQRLNACNEALLEIEAKLPKLTTQQIWSNIWYSSGSTPGSSLMPRRG